MSDRKPIMEIVPCVKVNSKNGGSKYFHLPHTAIDGVASEMFIRIVSRNHTNRGSYHMYHTRYDYDAWAQRMRRRIEKVILRHFP